MKRSIRVTTLSLLALASSLFVFAGGQPPIRPSPSEAQDVQGATRAVQQGKGGGMSRNQTVTSDANRAQTAQDSRAVRSNEAGQAHDSAFRK
jgi:hypothetical protein